MTSTVITPTATPATAVRPVVSLYEKRVRLVADALREHSELGDDDAVALAAHALHALDHIPETVR